MYRINSEITMIKCGEYSEDQEKPYIMIREGSAISALNSTAGIVLEKFNETPKELNEIIEELKIEFVQEEGMVEEIKNIVSVFLERNWVVEC